MEWAARGNGHGPELLEFEKHLGDTAIGLGFFGGPI